MTEAEWLACADPQSMLKFLEGRASERKLRLFRCACCQRVSDLFVDSCARTALEIAESYADGSASKGSRAEAVRLVHALCGELARAEPYDFGAVNAVRSVLHALGDGLQSLYAAAFSAQAARHRLEFLESTTAEGNAQAKLLHDLFGNPFRPVPVDPSWLAWNNGAVRKLAQVIYDERKFEDMPILADALEDAGCDSADILSHCRGAGPHVRGCWVLDLLLNKS